MPTKQKSLVLDTNVLLAHPELLESKLEGVEFIVPQTVVDELRYASVKQPRFEILASAIETSGNVVLVHGTTKNLPKSFGQGKMDFNDVLTIGAVFDAMTSGKDVTFVSNDRKLTEIVNRAGASAADSSILIEYPKSSGELRSPAASEYISEKTNARNQFISLAFVAGIAVTLFVQNVSLIVGWIQSAWRQYPYIVAIVPILFAVLAHAGKRLNQFLYGILEVLIGCLACYTTSVFVSTASIRPEGLTVFLTFASAAFIVIRGLGNMNDGLGLLLEYPKATARLRWLLDPARAYLNASKRTP
ncbi:PIN domain-containing protein [Sphingomonas sp. Leaf37]|uniref:PIN domain-containing protein n=1 Tax=Sphingomonas sp. Leaf37 TaxID=2876552 RepID=UPI0022A7BCDF|nr:PIN domain-containing protein [Sphingomonas sp. Leaf37]